jgi:N-acetylglucosaminyldiphosphoundecaprenol N-acetyl-beta-D-mannosaminyltransferase
MRSHGAAPHRSVLGVCVATIEPAAAETLVLDAAREGRSLTVSALAVHGVMTGRESATHRFRLNHIDLVTPDGQPVRWALNLLHRAGMREPVRGTDLTIALLPRAAAEGIPVYFYGSTQATLDAMRAALAEQHPTLVIAGMEPSKFRSAAPGEPAEIATRIIDSGARIVFVGLGCPRQEKFVYAFRDLLPMPTLAVGAAFDYIAGNLQLPPPLARRLGLEWVYRLVQEPRRLWRRYLFLNPAFVGLLVLQATRLWRPDEVGEMPDETEPLAI